MLKYNESVLQQVMHARDNFELAHIFSDAATNPQAQEVIDSMLNTFNSDYTVEGFIDEMNPQSFLTYQKQVMAILLGQSTRLIKAFNNYVLQSQSNDQPLRLDVLMSRFALNFERQMSLAYNFDGEAVLDCAIRNVIHQINYQHDLMTADEMRLNLHETLNENTLPVVQKQRLQSMLKCCEPANITYVYAWSQVEFQLTTINFNPQAIWQPLTYQTYLGYLKHFKTDYQAVINY